MAFGNTKIIKKFSYSKMNKLKWLLHDFSNFWTLASFATSRKSYLSSTVKCICVIEQIYRISAFWLVPKLVCRVFIDNISLLPWYIYAALLFSTVMEHLKPVSIKMSCLDWRTYCIACTATCKAFLRHKLSTQDSSFLYIDYHIWH